MEIEEDKEYWDGIKKQKERLKKFVVLLIDCEKDFTVETWGSGEGFDIIIPELITTNEYKSIPFNVRISIKNNGYVSFNLDDELENLIIDKDEEQ